jgi:hypothetical protein
MIDFIHVAAAEITHAASSFEPLVTVILSQCHVRRLYNKIGFKPFGNKINLPFYINIYFFTHKEHIVLRLGRPIG